MSEQPNNLNHVNVNNKLKKTIPKSIVYFA